MPIHLNDKGVDGISVVRATGTLSKEDYPPFVAEFERLLNRHGKLKIYFDMSDLKGWNADALWPELKFDAKHFSEIERLAAVGDKAWERGLMSFANPFTNATVRYFDVADAESARDWLKQP